MDFETISARIVDHLPFIDRDTTGNQLSANQKDWLLKAIDRAVTDAYEHGRMHQANLEIAGRDAFIAELRQKYPPIKHGIDTTEWRSNGKDSGV